ncbi:uncharacterized protein LOC105665536 [Ceratitis capitata]|uniref:uncharacterized protein LOC105665536 n=1 Tax=Ceratitis capitata TaxID=7213 RepID=UPI000618902B|nr:uncharacterized protein LOC105665536 [Ceratitis capitata]
MSKRLRNGPYVTKQRRFLEDFETFFHVSDSDSDTMNVTGYASYQKPHNLNRIQPLILKSATENNELSPIRKSRIGYNTIENSHSTQVLEELSSKEINLKDVMDIALTTLSFLSFGMFVLQILTFVTNENLDVNNIMLTHPVSTTFISGGDEIEEVRRKKRSSSKLLIPMKFDSLARRSLCLLDLYFNASGIHYPFYYSLITKYDEIMSNKLFDGIFLIPIWRFLQADKIHDEKYLH